MTRIELVTSSLPWMCSTDWATLADDPAYGTFERKTGLEPATYSLEGYRSTKWATSAWYGLRFKRFQTVHRVGREGFEPSKLSQRIYSPSHLATLVSPLLSDNIASSNWSRWRDSNPRPTDYKSVALANWATSAWIISNSQRTPQNLGMQM